MVRLHRAACTLLTAVALGLSAPLSTAEVGASTPSVDDECKFKFINGSTITGTATYGGITISFDVTINSCAPSGNDCKLTLQGYKPC